MIIVNKSGWVEIATTSVTLQKRGTNFLGVAYSAGAPIVGAASLAVLDSESRVFPLVTGKTLWARADSGNVSVTVEEIA